MVKYAKSFGLFKAGLFSGILLSLAAPAFAQGAEPSYTPPPMFEDAPVPTSAPTAPAKSSAPAPTPVKATVEKESSKKPVPVPPVKPRAPSAPVTKPAVTKPAVSKPSVTKPEITKPSVAKTKEPVVVKPAVTKVTEPKAKEVYISRTKPVEKAVKKTAEPSEFSSQTAVDEDDRTAPVKRDPKQSAIKGPKTMPALPTHSVEGEVTFQNDEPAGPEPTMLERQQQSSKNGDATVLPIVPRPKNNVQPASFEPNEQGVLKKTYTFEPGQITMSEADTDPLAAGVVKKLEEEKRENWRVQIKSYATPYGGGLSSDRRIALSRALSLRSSLITQGVSSSRIDVLAEGLQTDASRPGDRIDLYLYGPNAK